jgi:polyhydroxyalkanoate synthesis repressor PhaR
MTHTENRPAGQDGAPGPEQLDRETPPPVIVKKYANRRLYNTESSSYITLDNLADMIRAGRDFVVYDAKSGDDITRGVLTQIIVEEESRGHALLPTTFLRQLIGFYGDGMGGAVPRYLEQTMSVIARQQEQMREAVQQTMGTLLPPGLEEMRRQNMAMMERAMSLFSPFYRAAEHAAGPVGEPAAEPESEVHDQVRALQAEVAQLRQALAASQPVRPGPVLATIPSAGEDVPKRRQASGS